MHQVVVHVLQLPLSKSLYNTVYEYICNSRHFSTAEPYQVCQHSYTTMTSLQLCSHTHDGTAVMKHSVTCVCVCVDTQHCNVTELRSGKWLI